MEMLGILLVFIIAFACELVDSSLGMGYGTLLTPGLLLLGFPLRDVIPAVLLSQGFASLSASFFHVRYGNIGVLSKRNVSRTMLVTVAAGLVTLAFALVLALRIRALTTEIYIAAVIIIMGLIILWKRNFHLSLKRLSAMGLFAIFNKGLTGGGFGPTYTTGQVISGKDAPYAVGMTTLIEAPICFIAFAGYWLATGYTCSMLCVILSIGALLATPIGPYVTREYGGMTGRMLVGILAVILGIFLLIKNLIWPYLPSLMDNPFLWAFVSMFALMGASSTLVSPMLGRFLRLNILFVIVFSIGRLVLPLPLIDQPRIDLGGWEWAIGGPIMVIGVIFMAAIMQIKPWPSSRERTILVTTGFYSIVRHPCYLGEVLWALGLAIIFGSVLGIALTPLWWAGLLFLTVLEEEHLERELAAEYNDYRRKVRGRIFPGLPF